MPLEEHYAGDAAFARYVDALRSMVTARWTNWPTRSELVELCGGDSDIALAVFWLAGDNSLKWMESAPPVLDGVTPRECLKTALGRARLKEALLRSP